MSFEITIGLIDRVKEQVFNMVLDCYSGLSDCIYLDLRLGVSESKFSMAQKGVSKESREEVFGSIGIRVIAGRDITASGYFGSYIGPSDVRNLDMFVKEGISCAWRRAVANSSFKSRFKKVLGELGSSLSPTRLKEIEVCRDTFSLPFKEDPTAVPLQRVVKEAVDASSVVEEIYGSCGHNTVYVYTGLFRELFVSSEGAFIDQSYPLTEGFVSVVVEDEFQYDHLGGKGGWEVLYGDNAFNKTFREFAVDLARDTLELSKAPVLPSTDKEVVVVTDPHFNALLVHEIVGHPVEADRALKMETAYAGRSWFFRGFNRNQIGKKVASELVTVYSDASLHGYGSYRYDAEGVRAKRVVHIDRGIFRGFLNSRETALILDEEPNGSMRATQAHLVPLIRMSNTVFAPGERNPEDILREVDDGYYVVGHHTPSIGESRENFSISARRIYKIKDGNLREFYRSGAVTSDSRDFLMKVDAVGNDFKLFPMPNCGKGVPMQALRVGNGGPTMRSRAKLVGMK